jgi:flavoprotein
MSVEPERIRALDKATKQLLWDRMIASKQTVSTYVVVLDGGSLETMELSAAQAEGFECLTCRAQCSSGAEAFVPVGRIPSVGSVFQCVACSAGAR